MAQPALDQSCETQTMAARVGDKVWREVSRPFRRRFKSVQPVEVCPPAEAPEAVTSSENAEPEKPYLTGTGASIAGFHPQQATIEAECIPFVQRLVRESRQHDGPIV